MSSRPEQESSDRSRVVYSVAPMGTSADDEEVRFTLAPPTRTSIGEAESAGEHLRLSLLELWIADRPMTSITEDT